MNKQSVIQTAEKLAVLDSSLRHVNICLIAAIKIKFQMNEEGQKDGDE
jgi:uncharacterized protein YlbG (UPF0298 family)